MSETLRRVIDLIQRGEMRVSAHGYDELAADGILVREVIDGVHAVWGIPKGKSLAAKLGDKPVALMRGHGNVVAAPTVQTAVRYAIYTEVNARMQAIAIGLGGPITYISPEEGAAMGRTPADAGRAWDLWKKKALGK